MIYGLTFENTIPRVQKDKHNNDPGNGTRAKFKKDTDNNSLKLNLSQSKELVESSFEILILKLPLLIWICAMFGLIIPCIISN